MSGEEIAAAEQRGREDNADHGMCYVSGSKALEAKLAQAWDEGWNAAVDSDGHPGDVNPYRAEAPAQAEAADGWICEVCGCWNRDGDLCKYGDDEAHQAEEG